MLLLLADFGKISVNTYRQTELHSESKAYKEQGNGVIIL